jgi:hypothetical protein
MVDASDDVIYRHATYAPLVGTTFDVERGEGDHVPVELVDATSLPSRGEAFSLVFRGPVGVALEQRTYRLEHGAIGEFPLFLVPIGGTDGGAFEFEAVVNRLEA